MKKRALISVYDKAGIKDLAGFLVHAGWEIISTGGTFKFLEENKIPVSDVSSVTGFPECLDGRVKTLHPAIHAGILARRDEASHMETLQKLKLETIDLVCVNLYPFFEKVKENLGLEATVEFIDIGGPTLLRSAAKNFMDIIVLCDPDDYSEAMYLLGLGNVPNNYKKYLAGKVFNLTSAYDAAIARYLLDLEAAVEAGIKTNTETAMDKPSAQYPPFWPFSLKKSRQLRYGENNHQSAALYLTADKTGALGNMEQLGGKELGYNNIRDLDLAWKAACAFGLPENTDPAKEYSAFGEEDLSRLGISIPRLPVCVAVKDNTPCGIAQGLEIVEAYEKTYICDPVSIFGGIVACTAKIDIATAEKLSELYLEIVAAPDYDEQALVILQQKKNLRIMKAPCPPHDPIEAIAVDGGMLVQPTDRLLLEKWDIVTRTAPDAKDINDMVFGLRAVSYVKSNAIVVVKNCTALGIGGGQTNRIWAAEQALERSKKAQLAAAENKTLAETELADNKPARVLASDAFFPFADVVEVAALAGIKAIIQPGGSIRDKESIEACDTYGIAMVFTGTRHFKH